MLPMDILYRPYTMIAYESTANGTGNFFHKEWLAAKKGQSQFEPFFRSLVRDIRYVSS